MQTIVLYLCYIVWILLFSSAYNTSLIYCFVIWCLHTNKRRPCSSTLSGHPSSSFFLCLSDRIYTLGTKKLKAKHIIALSLTFLECLSSIFQPKVSLGSFAAHFSAKNAPGLTWLGLLIWFWHLSTFWLLLVMVLLGLPRVGGLRWFGATSPRVSSILKHLKECKELVAPKVQGSSKRFCIIFQNTNARKQPQPFITILTTQARHDM